MIKEYLMLGRVVGTHGVRGEMRVDPMCDTPDFAKQFKTVYVGGEGSDPTRVASCRAHGNLILMKLNGIDGMDAAEALRGTVLYVKRSDAKLPDGTWFIEELLDSRVTDYESGKEYGMLTDIVSMPANDVWTVRGGDGKEYLLPAIRDVVREVDPGAGIVKISPMRGIFDEPAEGD